VNEEISCITLLNIRYAHGTSSTIRHVTNFGIFSLPNLNLHNQIGHPINLVLILKAKDLSKIIATSFI